MSSLTLKKSLVVDIHTHIYPPSYISLLASRTRIPYIHQPSDPNSDPRLIILDSDDNPSRPVHLRGRPIDSSYSSWTEKLKFMSLHSIDISVVSLANPWLDFLPPPTALETTQSINNDLNHACTTHNTSPSQSSTKLYAFASLPLSAPPPQILTEIHRLKTLSCIKGVIMGTTGLGSGLDDPSLLPILTALASTNTLIFLHPHYGLPDSAFGGPTTLHKSGHVLPLALGFPLETTIAVTRLYLSGVFDKLPGLKLLLAHSGGTLPFLAGRIQSCVEHERAFAANGGDLAGPRRSIWDVLRHNIYLDAVIYDAVGLSAAVDASGSDRVMFGTDHPFFPPLQRGGKEGEVWASVKSNRDAIEKLGGRSSGDGPVDVHGILGGNAIRVLGLDI